MTINLTGRLAQRYYDLLQEEKKCLSYLNRGLDDHDGFVYARLGDIQWRLETIRHGYDPDLLMEYAKSGDDAMDDGYYDV